MSPQPRSRFTVRDVTTLDRAIMCASGAGRGVLVDWLEDLRKRVIEELQEATPGAK